MESNITYLSELSKIPEYHADDCLRYAVSLPRHEYDSPIIINDQNNKSDFIVPLMIETKKYTFIVPRLTSRSTRSIKIDLAPLALVNFLINEMLRS